MRAISESGMNAGEEKSREAEDDWLSTPSC